MINAIKCQKNLRYKRYVYTFQHSILYIFSSTSSVHEKSWRSPHNWHLKHRSSSKPHSTCPTHRLHAFILVVFVAVMSAEKSRFLRFSTSVAVDLKEHHHEMKSKTSQSEWCDSFFGVSLEDSQEFKLLDKLYSHLERYHADNYLPYPTVPHWALSLSHP